MNWENLLTGERIRAGKASSWQDSRSEFQKDYHRIVGSAAFRRLQDKTQVFPLDKSDFVRTRLTHSMEVASLAKSLGQSTYTYLQRAGKTEGFSEAQATQMSDILLCAGLIHDIGNPPFGHFGETVLRTWYREKLGKITFQGTPVQYLLTPQMRADLCNFEGNSQALRVVTKLHYLVDENGMNLTKALLNTIIKYPIPSTEINAQSVDIKYKKMGFFLAEEKTYQNIVESTGALQVRHPLTFLLEAADDIAYKTADIEDAYKKNLINFELIRSELWQNNYTEYEITPAYQGVIDAGKKLEDLLQRAKNKGIPNPEAFAIQNWVIYVQGCLIRAASESFCNHYTEIMSGSYEKELLFDTPAYYLGRIVSDIAVKYVFSSKGIVKLEIAAKNILYFLLDHFVGAVLEFDTPTGGCSVDKKLIHLVSDNYKNNYFRSSKGLSESEKLYYRLLLVNDYISGMTDSYAKSLYQELSGIY